MREFDSNLAGAYVRLEMQGRHVTGEVRAAWIEDASSADIHWRPTGRPATTHVVLMIELGLAQSDHGGAPAVVGEVRAFRYSPMGGDRLIVLHDEPRKVRHEVRHG